MFGDTGKTVRRDETHLEHLPESARAAVIGSPGPPNEDMATDVVFLAFVWVGVITILSGYVTPLWFDFTLVIVVYSQVGRGLVEGCIVHM